MRVSIFIACFIILLSCKNRNKCGIDKKIHANFSLMNDSLVKKICPTRDYINEINKIGYKNSFKTDYLCTIYNNTEKDIFVPCYKIECGKKGMQVLCVFQDSIFYKTKSMQKYNYKKPYLYQIYTKIKKGESDLFLFEFLKNNFVAVNIDSVIYDISYINKCDTVKQFIYLSKSNSDFLEFRQP